MVSPCCRVCAPDLGARPGAVRAWQGCGVRVRVCMCCAQGQPDHTAVHGGRAVDQLPDAPARAVPAMGPRPILRRFPWLPSAAPLPAATHAVCFILFSLFGAGVRSVWATALLTCCVSATASDSTDERYWWWLAAACKIVPCSEPVFCRVADVLPAAPHLLPGHEQRPELRKHAPGALPRCMCICGSRALQVSRQADICNALCKASPAPSGLRVRQ